MKKLIFSLFIFSSCVLFIGCNQAQNESQSDYSSTDSCGCTETCPCNAAR